MAVSPALGAKTWRAYLSTSNVDARDRIGSGPWYNAKGVLIANNLAQLHEEGGMMNMIRPNTGQPSNALDERGMEVPMGGGANGVHDILTGSTAMGRRDMRGHCMNWTSSATSGVMGVVGHHDRTGGGSTSWNSVHTVGCGPAPPAGQPRNGTVASGGGRGSFYCFATGQ
jgi:hypothetical protein